MVCYLFIVIAAVHHKKNASGVTRSTAANPLDGLWKCSLRNSYACQTRQIIPFLEAK